MPGGPGSATSSGIVLRDEADRRPFNETIQSGLYFRGATLASGSAQAVIEAFRFPFVAFKRVKGFSFWGRTPDSKGGAVRILIHTKRGWHKVDSHVTANRSGIFNGFVGRGAGRRATYSGQGRYRGERAVPFSLHDVKDFYQPPWGSSPYARSAVSPSR